MREPRYPSVMDKRRDIAMPARRKRRTAPHQFVLEALMPLEPEVRPMFSGFAVYVGDKIMLMLRDSLKSPADNGVWLVFSESAKLDEASILQDFPSLRTIELLAGKTYPAIKKNQAGKAASRLVSTAHRNCAFLLS